MLTVAQKNTVHRFAERYGIQVVSAQTAEACAELTATLNKWVRSCGYGLSVGHDMDADEWDLLRADVEEAVVDVSLMLEAVKYALALEGGEGLKSMERLKTRCLEGLMER